jgi:NitT/TauT family transport system substrate-binding protein
MNALASRARLSLRSAAVTLFAALAITSALAGCGASSADNGTTGSLTLGLTYVPNIQFAPFYVADDLGYYKAAGLSVTFHHHNGGEDEFAALVAGREDAIFASGDEVLGARAQDIPIVDVATIWTKYPVTLIVPANSSIQSPADLRGHTIGVPGAYGATYIGLLALLKNAGLAASDVKIQSIGFTQVSALLTHHVDAVMGYINNEPLQIKKAGMDVRTFDVAGAQPLISNGLAALQTTLDKKPDLIKALIKATLQGVDYTNAHPQEAVNISKKYVPGLNDPAAAADALAVLQATIPLWQTASGKPGNNDAQAWQSMESFLQTNSLLKQSVDASKAFSNDYLPS